MWSKERATTQFRLVRSRFPPFLFKAVVVSELPSSHAFLSLPTHTRPRCAACTSVFLVVSTRRPHQPQKSVCRARALGRRFYYIALSSPQALCQIVTGVCAVASPRVQHPSPSLESPLSPSTTTTLLPRHQLILFSSTLLLSTDERFIELRVSRPWQMRMPRPPRLRPWGRRPTSTADPKQLPLEPARRHRECRLEQRPSPHSRLSTPLRQLQIRQIMAARQQSQLSSSAAIPLV